MSVVEVWEPIPGLKDYVLSTWQACGRVEEVTDDSDERLMFMERAALSFIDNRFSFKRMRTWLNVMLPDTKTGLDKGYPHVHVDNRAMTLVHYIDAGDKPPALEIFDGDDVVETLVPQSNQTIYIPNGVKHGVYRNNGTLPRVAMIATAFPS